MKARWFLAILAVLVLTSCREASSSHESFATQLEHEAYGEPTNFSLGEPPFDTVLVEPDSGDQFHTTTRSDALVRYPCTSCHNVPLEEISSPAPAHQEVELDHAGPETMVCATCHVTENLDQLHTLTEQPIEFDRSFELCAQCHSTQADDWEGGAHGKRLEGWAPPRVVENCVGCHNPHAPGFESRWPAVTGGGTNE